MEKLVILHIEDEPPLAKLIGKQLAQLQSLPSEVTWAESLAAGLEVLHNHQVDLILLDLNLPDSQGLSTLERVRAAALEVPIVVITGIFDEDLYEKILGCGAQEFLAKEELSAKALLRVIHFALERKKSETCMLRDRGELERQVQERTKEIQRNNQRLLAEIEERRNVEQALRQSEEQHRLLLDSLPLSLALYDMDGKLMFVNAAFVKTFGWTKEELIGHRLQFVPQDRLSEIISRIAYLKQGLPVEPFETERLKKDGTHLNVRISTAPYRDGYGTLVGNIVTFRDLSRIKQTEKLRSETERRYQDLIEAMSEGLVEVDQDLRLVFYNESFADMLGYSRQELLGQTTPNLITEHSRQVMVEQWEKRKKGNVGSYEIAWVKKDGSLAHAIISGNPRFDSQGNFKGSIALITNITERKILESQLLQAQKLEAIGQLAAGMAHEINTPTQYVSDNTRFLRDAFSDVARALTSYLHLARLIKGQAVSDPAVAQALRQSEEVYQEIDGDYLLEEVPKAAEQTLEGLGRISTIVRSMKEFAHPGPDKKTPSDINRAIENTLTVAKNEWKYVAEVETELDPNLPMVPCVPGEVNQVFLNIIVNAAHAIADLVKESDGAKGRIKISTRRLDEEVEIRIADSGPGIPPALLERIFDPFFTTKPPGKGTGQGLAIAYRVVVDKHGGHLSVENLPGQGACFVIRLPLKESGRESQDE